MDNMTKAKVEIYPVGEVRYLLHHGADHINMVLRNGETWEEVTLALVKLFLDGIESPTVIDIGANVGAFTIPVAHSLKARGGRVFSFEPQRMVYYQLCGSVFVNALDNCRVYNLAVGESNAMVDIPIIDIYNERNIGGLSIDAQIREIQGESSVTPLGFDSVQCIHLDDFGLPSADLVKIDVEGLELPVLRGAQKWLEQSNWPVILFEVWGDTVPGFIGRKNELLDFVEHTLNYDVFIFGESCIAQHKSKLGYHFSHDIEKGMLYISGSRESL